MQPDELEALFEATRAEAERAASGVSGAAVPVVGPTPACGPVAGDAPRCAHAGPDGQCVDCGSGDARVLRERVGRLTRELHDGLTALRLDRTLSDMAVEMPDARNRLKYVVEMCERSARKVLDTLDELAPLQQATHDESAALLAAWEGVLDRRRRPDDGFLALFDRTRRHLATTVARAERTASLHSDIMVAQDFQDLTGQVCRRIEGITERIEAELLELLVDTDLEGGRERPRERLEGPQTTSGGDDAVKSQSEVDDLLRTMGF
jgi:chemotaxis protein CheZ